MNISSREPVAMLQVLLAALLLFCLTTQVCHGQDSAKTSITDSDTPDQVETSWGLMETDREAGLIRLTINESAKEISLPTPMPNITRATLGTRNWPGDPLTFSFNHDATEVKLRLPAADKEIDSDLNSPWHAVLDIAEESRQFPDGRIVLSALDAKVDGQKAKLETHPGNHRIGFWVDPNDSVAWNYKATRPGKYNVFLTYSCAIPAGEMASDIEVNLGSDKSDLRLKGTGSWYDYSTIKVCEVYFDKPVEQVICVKCTKRRGAAVMNLKSVTLVPACEGSPPVQADDGSILLHARDATANGILLQWEPSPKKRTLGYWANENDFAYWDFEVNSAGTFEVEIMQGCGKGQGGSVVEFNLFQQGDEVATKTWRHVVKDTGHWQAFEPAQLGKVSMLAGQFRLRVHAVEKARGAVMDLPQVLFSPTR